MHSHQQCMTVIVSPRPCKHLAWLVILILAVSHGLICHLCIPPVVSVEIFCQYFIRWFVSYYWVLRVLYMFYILLFYQLAIFFQSMAYFSLIYQYLSYNIFNFDEIQFINYFLWLDCVFLVISNESLLNPRHNGFPICSLLKVL